MRKPQIQSVLTQDMSAIPREEALALVLGIEKLNFQNKVSLTSSQKPKRSVQVIGEITHHMMICMNDLRFYLQDSLFFF